MCCICDHEKGLGRFSTQRWSLVKRSGSRVHWRFEMALRILAEFVLAVVALFVGATLWQLQKRKVFLRGATASQPFLERLITRKTLANPPPQIEPYLAKNNIGYFINIEV